MRRLVLIVVAVVTVGFAGHASAAGNIPGTENRSVDVGGVTRTFTVHVGSSAAADTAAPVVFMFHGSGGDGQRSLDTSGWRETADREGLITVFPDALTYCYGEDSNGDGDFVDAFETQVTTKWTAGNLGDPAVMPVCDADVIARLPDSRRTRLDHPFQDDLLFVAAMVDFLRTNYLIDEKRLYASGFSNGAQFVARLAMERSDVFAALSAHSGGLVIPSAPARPISFLQSVGSVDYRMAVLTGLEALPIADSLPSDVPQVGQMIAAMISQLGLADEPRYELATIGDVNVGRFEYTNSKVGAGNAYTFLVIGGNDHDYPNGQNHPLVLADVLWAFFSAHVLQ